MASNTWTRKTTRETGGPGAEPVGSWSAATGRPDWDRGKLAETFKEYAVATIRLHQTTTATPGQILAGLTDFGPGRSKIFPNSADRKSVV